MRYRGIFVVITSALTFNSNSVAMLPIIDFFQFCTPEISKIEQNFGNLSLTAIENSLFWIFFNMKL